MASKANPLRPGSATPRLIRRGELLTAFDRAVEAKVTLISAPAGSGKTSLLRAWADGPGQRYRLAVVQVRRDQQDAQQFWLAVLSAIRQASGTSGAGEQLAATPDFNQEAIADRVRSEFAEHRDRTFLIIDDLHELTSPEALTELTRLLEKLPQHVHAILATRRDLPLRLHKLRLAGELADIRAADLRFTEPETHRFLEASGIVLSEAGVARLHQRTEGWAAGLRLAAMSLASSPDPERFVAEFSGSSRTVAEYLLAEMLECQPAEVQQLLLRTAHGVRSAIAVKLAKAAGGAGKIDSYCTAARAPGAGQTGRAAHRRGKSANAGSRGKAKAQGKAKAHHKPAARRKPKARARPSHPAHPGAGPSSQARGRPAMAGPSPVTSRKA